MSLYLWHSGSSVMGWGMLGALIFTGFLVWGVMGSMEGTREPILMSSDRVDIDALLGWKEMRTEGGVTGTAVGYGIISVIIFLFLGLNLQGVAGGGAMSFDSGGLVFSLSTTLVLGVMLESAVAGAFCFSATMLPTGSPVGLATFIVIMELASGVIRCFTLGIRLMANMLVGQILLFMWISALWSIMAVMTTVTLPWYFSVGVYFFSLPVLILGSLAFCYETFVYFFQSFLYGLLLLFYMEDTPHSYSIALK